MTSPPTISAQLREVAIDLGVRDNYDGDLGEMGMQNSTAIRLATRLTSLASELERLAEEMRRDKGRWTITPGLQGGPTEEAVEGTKVEAWASRLATAPHEGE